MFISKVRSRKCKECSKKIFEMIWKMFDKKYQKRTRKKFVDQYA